MKLGFIGFGEVGFEISRGLNKEGLSGIVAYDPLWIDQKCGKLMNQRAQECFLESIERSFVSVSYDVLYPAARNRTVRCVRHYW